MAQRGKSAWPVSVYVGLVAALAGALLVKLFLVDGIPDWKPVSVFWVLYLIAELKPTEVASVAPLDLGESSTQRRPALSGGVAVLVLAAFALDPAAAAVVGGLSALNPSDWRGWFRTLFNSSQGALYTGGAGILVTSIYGFSDGFVAFGLSVLAVAGCVVGLNVLLVAGAVALDGPLSFKQALRRLAWPSVSTVAFVPFGWVVAQMYRADTSLGFLPLVGVVAAFLLLKIVRTAQFSLTDARDDALRALASAVDVKDPYTYRHSERVASIVVALHRQLGSAVCETELRSRYLGALLHDVGKIAVPSSILLKEGRLTREEYEVVKRHPAVGAAAIRKIAMFADIVPDVELHHERMDGLGYPLGLAGSTIPFSARVLAVADAFEALTSQRPYRAALSTEAAIEEIVRCAGSQFDPKVVEALLAVYEGNPEALVPHIVHEQRSVARLRSASG